MLISWRVPKTIQWIVKLFIIYLCIFTAFRIATVISFKPKNTSVFELGPSFWLGLKYDLRWIAFREFEQYYVLPFRETDRDVIVSARATKSRVRAADEIPARQSFHKPS